jgi:hypothetical protein
VNNYKYNSSADFEVVLNTSGRNLCSDVPKMITEETVVMIICNVFTVASNKNVPFLEIDVMTIYKSPAG